MIAKTFEIRDRLTFIPVLAVKLQPSCEADRYLLARTGYGLSPHIQAQYAMVWPLSGGKGFATSDPYEWPTSARTFLVAHRHIIERFDELESGAVVDVEFILGETQKPKKSEREEC